MTWVTLFADTSSAGHPLALFDKGVAIAVLAGGGIVFGVLLRRWLRLVDTFEARDAEHVRKIQELTEKHTREVLDLNEKHHKDLLDQSQKRIERDERVSTVLLSISDSLKVIRSELARWRD